MTHKDSPQLAKILQSMEVKPRSRFYRKVRLLLFWKYHIKSFSHIFTSLTHVSMKKMITAVVAIAFIAIAAFGVVRYYSGTTPAYLTHVANAEKALVKIEKILHGEQQATMFIPKVYAEEETLTDAEETEISDLTEEAVEEINKAVESAENELTDLEEKVAALDKIELLMQKAETVFETSLGVVQNENTEERIANAFGAIAITHSDVKNLQVRNRERVRITNKIGTGSIAGNNNANESSEDTGKMIAEKAQVRIQEAREMIERLKIEGVDTTTLESKMGKAEVSLEKGKTGQAYGLSTAALKKGEAELRRVSAQATVEESQENENGNKSGQEGNGNKNENDESDSQISEGQKQEQEAHQVQNSVQVQQQEQSQEQNQGEEQQNQEEHQVQSSEQMQQGQNQEQDIQEQGGSQPVQTQEPNQEKKQSGKN